MNAPVDRKWARQSTDAQGNSLVMVNVLAQDREAQWPASEKRYEPGALQEQLGHLLEGYLGLKLPTLDTLYAERDPCQATVIQGWDNMVRIQGNRFKDLAALSQRVFPKVIQAGANRRSMRWVIAMYTQDSVISGKAS